MSKLEKLEEKEYEINIKKQEITQLKEQKELPVTIK